MVWSGGGWINQLSGPRQPDGSWLQWCERSLLVAQSLLCFGALFRGMMGFSRFGHFVLMLVAMIQQDMRKFLIIYFVCLLWFSHILNVILDKTNTGSHFPSSAMPHTSVYC